MGCAKSKTKHVAIPWTLASHSRQEWIAWRNCFLTYMHEHYIPVYKQGNKFFELIGNVGLEIAKNFYYHNTASETDINTLLFKFDVYFIFGCRKRHANESIGQYVTALKDIAEKTAKSNIEKVLKEKLLQDLKSEKMFEEFSKIVPSFSNVTDYETLALHELIFIWEECERPQDIKEWVMSLEARKRDAFEHIRAKNRCLHCDKFHIGEKCKAMGEKCWKCGNFNHFARCCLKTYVKDCPFCGTDHVQTKCPAFAKDCPRCKKMNHFSWQCFTEMILICDFCGQGHINNRQHCPAVNSTCCNCRKKGHYSFKCRSRRNKK
ncbi:uncharacterized protein LOC106644879 [Copidosoma floridanum]|uniref:uncharacterized protein LOC106644879 n=1 Tax=Copidosoma floridanum TaxID=29053 RepID=UPI0006C97618|nr:uncharacterized protein LOC106644879 [Copidosoma floridanum]